MPHQGESKTCKMCCEEIAAAAKKCPHCHHWQHWLSTTIVHPLFGFLFFIVPLAVLWIMGIVLLGNVFRKGEPFQNHADQITITESRMEFGQDHCGPTVAVVGKMKNSSRDGLEEPLFPIRVLRFQGIACGCQSEKGRLFFHTSAPSRSRAWFSGIHPPTISREELCELQDLRSFRGGQYAEVPPLRLTAHVSGVYRTRNCNVIGAGDDRPGVGEDR